jgi:hypothetical protein
MIIIPETIILDTLKKILKLIRLNYLANISTPSNSFLYKLLSDGGFERFKYFENAVKIFNTKPEDPRHLDVNLFFNFQKQGTPTIHITLPSENQKNNSLGLGLGTFDAIEEQEGDRDVLNRRYSAAYNLVITSDNSNEVVLIYHIIKSFIITANQHFTHFGLENLNISGRDLQINSNNVPANLFMRSLGIGLEYNTPSLELNITPIINRLDFSSSIVDE